MTRRRIETRGVKSYPSALEKGIRSERALKPDVAELYVRNVSSREVASMTEPLCGPEVTDSQVSRGRIGPCRRAGEMATPPARRPT